jgi:hypothetical protein
MVRSVAASFEARKSAHLRTTADTPRTTARTPGSPRNAPFVRQPSTADSARNAFRAILRQGGARSGAASHGSNPATRQNCRPVRALRENTASFGLKNPRDRHGRAEL